MSERTSNSANIQNIVKMRLQGIPVSQISEELGISRNYIYIVLSRLPKEKNTTIRNQTVSSDLEFQVIMKYFEKYPSDKMAKKIGQDKLAQQIVGELSKEFDLPQNTIFDILYHATDMHPIITKYPLYTAIERWKTRCAISTQDLANAIGVQPKKISDILCGMEHMPLNYAKKIKNLSGLKIGEIYHDLLMLDAKEKEMGTSEKEEK